MQNINRFYIFLFAIFSCIGIACADVLIIRYLVDTEGVDLNAAVEEEEVFFYYGGEDVDGADLGIDVVDLKAQINPIVLDGMAVDDANAAALAAYENAFGDIINKVVTNNAVSIGANDIFIQFQQDYESVNGLDASFIMSGASGALAGGTANILLSGNDDITKDGNKYILVDFYQDWFDPIWKPPAFDIEKNFNEGYWGQTITAAYENKQNRLEYRVVEPGIGGNPAVVEGPYVIGGAGGYNVKISGYVDVDVSKIPNIHSITAAYNQVIELDKQAVIKCLAGVPPEDIKRERHTATATIALTLSADECPNQTWTGTGSGSPLDENPATIQDIINFHEAQYAIVNVHGFYHPISLSATILTAAAGGNVSGSTVPVNADFFRDSYIGGTADFDYGPETPPGSRKILQDRLLREHCFYVEFEINYKARYPGYAGETRKYWVTSADDIVNLGVESPGLIEVPFLTVIAKHGFNNPHPTIFAQGAKIMEDVPNYPARLHLDQFGWFGFGDFKDSGNVLIEDYLQIPLEKRGNTGYFQYVKQHAIPTGLKVVTYFPSFRMGNPIMLPDPYYRYMSSHYRYHEGDMITFFDTSMVYPYFAPSSTGDSVDVTNTIMIITVVGAGPDGVAPEDERFNTIDGVNVLDYPQYKYGMPALNADPSLLYKMLTVTSRYGHQRHYIGNVVCERNADFTKDPDDGEWKNFRWKGAPYACSATDGYGGMTLTSQTKTLTFNGHGTTVQIGGDEVILRVSTGVDRGDTIALDLRRCSQNLHFFDNYCKASDGTESVAYTGDQMCAADELCLLRDEQVLLPYPKTHMDGIRRDKNLSWTDHIETPNHLVFWPHQRAAGDYVLNITDGFGKYFYFEQSRNYNAAIPFVDPRYNSFWVDDSAIDDDIPGFCADCRYANLTAAIRSLGKATGGNFSSVDRRSPLEGSSYNTLLDLWGEGSSAQLEYNQSHAHQCIPKDVLKGEKKVDGVKLPIFSNKTPEVANGSICEGLIFEKLTTVSFDYPVTIIMQDTDSPDPNDDIITVTFNITSGLEHPDPDDELDAGTLSPAICVPYRYGGHSKAIQNFNPMDTFIGGSYGRLDPTPSVYQDAANGNDGNVTGFPGPYCKDHDTTDGFDPCEWFPDKHPDSD